MFQLSLDLHIDFSVCLLKYRFIKISISGYRPNDLQVKRNMTALRVYGEQGSKQQKPNLSLAGVHDDMRKELEEQRREQRLKDESQVKA